MSTVSVAEYYAGKSVFITGATGFMGKVLVEKLLRSCPGLEAVYVLIRSKNGKMAKDRRLDYLNNRVFERIQGNQDISKKVKIIVGDVTLADLGISESDREVLQRKCHIVFHCAATVRFDTFLRDAVNINILGTKKVLELATGMKNLEAFIHVSTSFCRDYIDVLEEKVYPSRFKVEDILQCMRWMDDDMVKYMEPKIINPLPNTYSFTKCLAEDVVLEYQGKFPLAIARPSIVTAAVKEPFPGWVDNINGPTGLIYAAARGVLRTVYCQEKTPSEIIPVDYAINGCILLAYNTGLNKPKEISVCNITQSGINTQTWGESGKIWQGVVQKYPLSLCLWYPNATPTNSRLVYNMKMFLTQFLPACFLDLLLFLLGKKTFMLTIYYKINHGAELLEYYVLREWKFKNDFFLSLGKRISKEDNKIFKTDMASLDRYTYMENYVKGVREFYCKEDPSTLPKAKKLHTKLYILHVTSQILFVCLALYLFYTYCLK